jgi:hypothetical protein
MDLKVICKLFSVISIFYEISEIKQLLHVDIILNQYLEKPFL